MSGFLGDNSPYFDKNGLCGWEKTKDEQQIRAEKIGNSWKNRNALHVDVYGQVGETKKVFQRLWDSLQGIRDDDSRIDGLGGRVKVINEKSGIKHDYGINNMVDRFELMNDHKFILQVLGKKQIYSPGKGVEGVEFVRLNDKYSYIKEMVKLSLNYKAKSLYDRYLRLKDNGEDIGGDFIVTFESTLEENNELHIFAYGLKNGFISITEFAEIIFDDKSETMESFLTKYGDPASIERICNELVMKSYS